MQMPFPQLIQDAKMRGYYAASCGDEIAAQYERILAIREKDLIGNVLYDLRIARALIELKLAFTRFVERGMLSDDLDDLSEAIEQSKADYFGAKLALNPSYVASESQFKQIEAAAKKLSSFAEGIAKDFDALLSDGAFKGTLADYADTVEKYKVVSTEPISSYFPDREAARFSFISVKKAIFNLIGNKMREVRTAMFEDFMLEGDFRIDTIDKYSDLTLVPSRSLAKDVKETPVIFVSTPIREEFDILLNANYKWMKKILQFDLPRLSKMPAGVSADSWARFFLFVILETGANAFAFYGLDKLTDEVKRDVYAAIYSALKMSPTDVRFIFWDESGDMSGLSEYNRARKDLPLVMAENFYLRLPSFEDVKSVGDLFDAQRLERIRKECVFMGYRGLNLFFSKKEELGLAFDSARSISAANEAAALRFVDVLTDKTRLIPLDWGYTITVEEPEEEKTDEYNYDEIRDVSDERIRIIIANPKFNIYQKCGELVRYILLADEDKSVWMGNLTEEERAARIKKAVRIIAYTMRVYHSNPSVEVVDTREGGWGGYCSAGGAEIRFKKNCVEGDGGIEWTMDAILHELYHSLQHTVTDTPVNTAWYKKTYHISEERIASWYSNSKSYVDIDVNREIYEVQVMEADARDFAGLCLGDQVYHRHTYEKNRGTL